MNRTESAGPSSETWEAMKPHIHERYIKEGRTLTEVTEIMRTEHGFNASRKMYKTHFTKWGPHFDKNKKRGRSRSPTRPSKGRRTRPKTLHPSKLARVPGSASSVLPTLAPYPYRNAQIALVSVGNYTEDILKTISGDPFTIVPQNNTHCQARTWKHLGDQIWGATQLMMNGKMEKGMSVFSMACNQLWRSGAVRTSDAAMMVKFWRICHRLYRTERTINGGVRGTDELRQHGSLESTWSDNIRSCTCSMLSTTRRMTSSWGLWGLPIVELLTPWSHASVREHLTVLEMRSSYFKFWSNNDESSSARGIFMERYPAILATAEQLYGRTGEPTIRVLHDLVYALNYNVKDRDLTTKFALDALERVQNTLRHKLYPTWGMATQTCSFTAKLLATISLDNGQRNECRAYLQDAITTLERGDRECRTRALTLADILQARLTEWGELDQLNPLNRWDFEGSHRLSSDEVASGGLDPEAYWPTSHPQVRKSTFRHGTVVCKSSKQSEILMQCRYDMFHRQQFLLFDY
ncbi:hypothetical protein V8F33_005057 [Rhypophila sp. PSN 637]